MLHTHRLWTAALAAALLTASATAGTRPVAAIHKRPVRARHRRNRALQPKMRRFFTKYYWERSLPAQVIPAYTHSCWKRRTSNDENL